MGCWTDSVSNKRPCRRSLSIFEAQHLFKSIHKFSYFTFVAFNFLLTRSFSLIPFFIIHLLSQSSAIDLKWRSLCFNLRACMINVWTCFLYDELVLQGVSYGRNSCMIKHEFLFLLKLYNGNFLSDGHYVIRKSWIQDASRRTCSDAKQCV